MIITRRHALATLGACAAGATLSGKAFAQAAYPTRSVRMITSGVGSDSDFITRLVAQGMTEQLGQPVVVENRDGSITPGLTVAQATPDGYTLLCSAGTLWQEFLLQKMPFSMDDLLPITLVTRAPKALVVHPSIPVKTVADLIAYAKAHPGALNYASSGIGSTSHLAVATLALMAGVEMTHVPFKQNAALMASLLGGETQVAILSPGSVMPQAAAGKLTALAVTSLEPSTLVPGLPTVASTLPGYESQTVYGIFAPAKTPAPIVDRVHDVVVKLLDDPDTKKKILDDGNEPMTDTPAEFSSYIKSELANYGKVVQALGLGVK